ncbi:MAG TPA: toxin-antitoxin system [Candidatus Angelobacter sp.]|nr:toxin-antitoxin system [Candidatus Angelobacter sp.]
MAQLVVRDLEQSVKTRLQRRAKRHGRSMEEEVREILRDAAKDEPSGRKGLGTRIASRFRKIGLKKGEEFPELKGFTIEPPDFAE